MTDKAQPLDIRLLVVDDDSSLRGDLASFFESRGYQVTARASSAEALQAAETMSFDVAILDLVLPGMSGLELLQALKKVSAECEVLVFTGEGSIESAVEAMKHGAHDYLTKPVRLTELEAIVRRAHQSAHLRSENQRLKAALKQQSSFLPQMVGESACMTELRALIERVGRTDKPILIQGESGTGKELVARALHRASPLADCPLVVINCAALPETLLESELFGHEKGAFTGAQAAKPGLFEVADGGTLFIDEIGELAGSLQAKLLRVLEDGSMRRIGSIKERRVKVRLIAATNRDMEKEVKAGRFREDLYYRINVLTIPLPPLREREGDLPILVRHFLGPHWKLDPQVMPALLNYPWPGNVRQLQNALERAKVLADSDWILAENLPPEIRPAGSIVGSHSGMSPYAGAISSLNVNSAHTSRVENGAPVQADGAVAGTSTSGAPHSAPMDLESLNRRHILETYQKLGGNKARTARVLGVGRRSLYRMLEKYGIHDPSSSTPAS